MDTISKLVKRIREKINKSGVFLALETANDRLMEVYALLDEDFSPAFSRNCIIEVREDRTVILSIAIPSEAYLNRKRIISYINAEYGESYQLHYLKNGTEKREIFVWQTDSSIRKTILKELQANSNS